MAAKGKERQKNYRDRQRLNGAKILDIILQNETSDQLTELSLHGDKTKTALLSELVVQAYNEKKGSHATAPKYRTKIELVRTPRQLAKNVTQ